MVSISRQFLVLFIFTQSLIASLKLNVVKTSISSITSALIFLNSQCPAFAVSGGGKDFANLDLRDGSVKFEGGTFIGKDFTQVLADRVSFKNAKLRGSRFYKAALQKGLTDSWRLQDFLSDFSNADLSTASLEDAGLEDATFDGANLSGSYLSSSFESAGSIKNTDFSDSLMPKKTTAILCARPDAIGTNPMTGVDTRDSLLCE